jgi:FKBP-type peptidyl-prolyl cis-trans isomerase 2|tara:strand:- start:1573 stop:2232 length:660 start_codon:yes stop_codon:yes gene_type:complete
MTISNKLKKNDFIEIDFTGSSNGQIFDTTIPEKAKEIMPDTKNIKPLIVSIGNGMLLQGLDEDLEGKEIVKTYSIHIDPIKAFGKRDPSLIRTYGLSSFTKNNIHPQPGMALQLDNQIVRVVSVSGGRVTVDFNNPLAGKEVDYEYKVNKIITGNKEKVEALLDFFLKQRFDFSIKDNKVIFKDEKLKSLLPMFAPKFKDITGLEFEVAEKKEITKNRG